MVEAVGFEPTVRSYPYSSLAGRYLKPLGHASMFGGDEWIRTTVPFLGSRFTVYRNQPLCHISKFKNS